MGKDFMAGNAKEQIGASMLAKTGLMENKYKNLANSTLERSKKQGEKLVGNPVERRSQALISRLEKLVEKRGSAFEKRLLGLASRSLIVKPENITDAYWQVQEQILRDNGQGRTLSQREKEILIEDIQKSQKESLQSWIDYLGSEDSPYPVWFKIYAWEGMARLGVFDAEKKKFKKRDQTTVAPFPKLNPAALAKVYGEIMHVYGIDQQDYLADNPEQEALMKDLVQKGNFGELYAKMMLETKVILKTPERVEDIDGEWQEYLPGQEEELAQAAEGTPWCIANPGTGQHYLESGSYVGDNSVNPEDNQAKFILFHLRDKDTKQLASNACASIRLGIDGQVAEISGLNQGQALEDSLVPIVEAKVKTLPGGEKFLAAFADKQELIRLDRKLQSNEPFTKEELEFVYEINRPINTLDTYNAHDPRIDEIQQKYSLERALDLGIDVNKMLASLDSAVIAQNLETLLEHGAKIDVNDLVSRLHRWDIAENLETLLEHGAKTGAVVAGLDSFVLAQHLETLFNYGVDINEIVNKLESAHIAQHLEALFDLETLLEHGAKIDVNDLVGKLYARDIAENLETLLEHGAKIDVNDLVGKLSGWSLVHNLEVLLKHGAKIDVNDAVDKSDSLTISYSLGTLFSHGANVNTIVNKLESSHIAANLETLLEHGADVNTIVSKLDNPRYILRHFETLLKYGADADTIAGRLDKHVIIDNLEILLKYGADINTIVNSFDGFNIVKTLETVLKYGADVNVIVNKLESSHIAVNLETLLEHGADVNMIVSKLSGWTIANNLETLLEHGADANMIVGKLSGWTIAKNLETLLKQSVNIDMIVSKLNRDDIAQNLETLVKYGGEANATVRQLKEKSLTPDNMTLFNKVRKFFTGSV